MNVDLKYIIKKHFLTGASLLFLIIFSVFLKTYANPLDNPPTPYNPGETLDPSCYPSTDNCTVAVTNSGGTNALLEDQIAFGDTNNLMTSDSSLLYDSTGKVLTINGNIKIVDGNQANGKVLTSDADGLASWHTADGGSAGVSSLNNLTGAVTLSEGANIHLNKTGNDIEIVSTGSGSSGGTGWSLSGNSGTDSSNFLGTLDDVPLIFRVNGTLAGILDDATSQNTFYGYQAGYDSISGAVSSHRIINSSRGTIDSLNVTNGGSGYTTATVTIDPPTSGTTATATANISTGSGGGEISDLNVTNGGSGYTTATVTIDPPTSGTTATATANISTGSGGGEISDLNVTNGGSGYTTATVTIDPPTSGTTATATANISTDGSETITGFTITSPGSGYDTAPNVSISGDGNSATATATLSTNTGGETITGFTITNPGSGYTTTPSISISGDGNSATATATVSSDTTSGVITGFNIINPGSGYTTTPRVSISGDGNSATATANVSTGSGMVGDTSGGATNSGNVFLGYQAGYFETGNNNLYIDNQMRAGEDDARIKALIYGKFDADTANQFVTINGALNVNGPIKIVDSTQGVGKVLTSDADGLASWQTPSGGTGSGGWALTGNAITSSDFLGTTNDEPLNFEAEGLPAGKIDNDLYNVFFGYQSGNSNTTGGENLAVGFRSLYFNTTGNGNIAFGGAALYNNLGGLNNTAIGSEALQNNTAGGSNIALGNTALFSNTTGSNNIAFGLDSLHSNSTGNNNVALGFDSLYHALGNSNVGLGSYSGYNETGSNNLYIDNKSDTPLTSLIYGKFDASAANQFVNINGTLGIVDSTDSYYSKFKGGSQLADITYTLPIAQGGASTVLTNNGSGILSWIAPGTIGINPETDDYTLAISDAGKLVEMNKGTAVLLIVPLNISVGFPIGTTISVIQKGAGKVNFVAADGVTINSKNGLYTSGRFAGATLIKVDTNTWYLNGDVTSS